MHELERAVLRSYNTVANTIATSVCMSRRSEIDFRTVGVLLLKDDEENAVAKDRVEDALGTVKKIKWLNTKIKKIETTKGGRTLLREVWLSSTTIKYVSYEC